MYQTQYFLNPQIKQNSDSQRKKQLHTPITNLNTKKKNQPNTQPVSVHEGI